MKRLFLLFILVVGVAGAQSDEEAALLEWVFRAVEQVNNLESARTETIVYSRGETTVSQSGLSQYTFKEYTLTGTSQVIWGDNPNGFSQLRLEKTSRRDSTEVSGEIQAELIYADGALYARAINLAEASQLPNAWQVVQNPADYPQLEDLGVETFLEGVTRTGYNPFTETDLIESLVEEILTESTTLLDGTPAQHIQLVFSALTLPQFLRQDPDFANNDLSLILFNFLGEDSQLTLDLYVDETGGILAWGSTFYLVVDNQEVTSNSQRFLISVEIEGNQFTRFADLNPELEPVPAP